MGLVPAGDSGTFFQTIPLKTRTLDSTSTFTAGGAPLVAFDDYLPLTRAPATNAVAPSGVRRHPRGFRTSVDRSAGGGEAGGAADRRAQLAARHAPRPNGAGRLGLALVGLDSLPPPFLAQMRRPQPFMDDNQPNQPAQPPILLISSSAAAKLFPAPFDSLAAGAAGNALAIDVKWIVAAAEFPSRNVVAIVPGSDPRLKGEYVAIGAHNDHIGLARPLDHDSIRIWNHVVRPEGADDFGKQASPAQQAT